MDSSTTGTEVGPVDGQKPWLTFVSGNEAKVRDAAEVLADTVQLRVHRLDLTEIQGSAREVVKQKCLEALRLTHTDVLVEDSCEFCVIYFVV